MSRRRSADRSLENLDQTIPTDNNSPQDTRNLLSFTPVSSTRVSLPISGANPGDLFSGKEVAEISVDNLLIRESDLNSNTEDLLLDITKGLEEIDKIIIEFNIKTNTNMDGNSEPSTSSNQPNKIQQPKSQESGKQVDWSTDSNLQQNFPVTEEMRKQRMREIVKDGANNGSTELKRKNSDHMEHLGEFNLDVLINQRMEELRRNYSLKSENRDQKQTCSNSLSEMIDAKILAELGKRGYTETSQSEPSMSNYISLKEALNLLPKSCDGRDIEQLDIFLENCEFAVS